jgi:hypothetical protein
MAARARDPGLLRAPAADPARARPLRVAAARSLSDFLAACDAVGRDDWESIDRMLQEGRITMLPGGTAAVVGASEPTCVRVEVLDGPEAGAELWVARSVVVCA